MKWLIILFALLPFSPKLTPNHYWLKNNYKILPISNEHIFFAYQNLSLFSEHKGPFDLFIIATAKSEGFHIKTSDEKFSLYSTIVNII